jgi:hypothetical protein
MKTWELYATIASGIVLLLVGIYWKTLWDRIKESIESELSFDATLLGIFFFVIAGLVCYKITDRNMMIIPIIIGFIGVYGCIFGSTFDSIVSLPLLLMSIGIAWLGYISIHTKQPLYIFLGMLLFSLGIRIRRLYRKRKLHKTLSVG